METKGCLQLMRNDSHCWACLEVWSLHCMEWCLGCGPHGRHGELLVKEILYIQMVAKDHSFNKDEKMELYDCRVAAVRRAEQASWCYEHNHLVTSVCLVCSTTVSDHTSLCLFILQSVSVFISHLLIGTVRSKALAFRQRQKKISARCPDEGQNLGNTFVLFFFWLIIENLS